MGWNRTRIAVTGKQPGHPTASQEDYLEAILGLIGESGAARVRDIAKRMKVANSSVTVALRSLARKKLVDYRPYELVTLTARGRLLAERIRRRHKALSDFLTGVLDVDEKVAETNACRIEHAVGDLVMGRLSCFLDFMFDSAVPAKRLPRAFRRHCENLRLSGQCPGCRASTERAIRVTSSLKAWGHKNEQRRR